jgi:hypothetical protein
MAHEQHLIHDQRPRLYHGARYQLALETIRKNSGQFCKVELQRQAGVCFNSERWARFQEIFQKEILVHPITGKVYWAGET